MLELNFSDISTTGVFRIGRQVRIAIKYTSFVLVPFCLIAIVTADFSGRLMATVGLVLAVVGF